MSKQMDQAIQSVIDLHVLIENVFTGQNAEQSLTPLLNSFDQNFKMVTVQVSVDFALNKSFAV